MKEMSCKYNKNLMRGRLNKEAVNVNLKETDRVSDTVNHETIIQGKENIIKEPKIKLEESQTEYNKEKIKFYKSQITVLEERNKSYTLTTHFKDEVLRTQDETHITEEDWEHPKRNKDKTPGVTVTNKSLDVSDKEKLKIVNSNDQDNRNDKQLNITENTEEVESQKKDKITNLLCITSIKDFYALQPTKLQDVVSYNNIEAEPLRTIATKKDTRNFSETQVIEYKEYTTDRNVKRVQITKIDIVIVAFLNLDTTNCTHWKIRPPPKRKK
jgi:hypothetical protein